MNWDEDTTVAPKPASSTSGLVSALGGNVFMLGLTSFFTDLSSEMIYPLLPVFIAGLAPAAAVPMYIGLMDGIAESTSSLLKIIAGRLSDRWGKRKPLVVWGYSLSSLARPMTALAFAGWHVIALRFFDRIGKGLRSSPRDALLSDSVDSRVRGTAFSFQRLMDHAGAVTGPLAAMALLYAMLGKTILWRHGQVSATAAEMHALRVVFGIAVIPGIAAVTVLITRVREDIRRIGSSGDNSARNVVGGSHLPKSFYVYLGAVTLFTLGNSTDLFLIYYTRSMLGLGIGWMIVLWILLHLSKILFSMPGGRLSDTIGRRRAIFIGWLIYSAVYWLMPYARNLPAVCVLLFVYGAYYGMTEGAERALVADYVPPEIRGKAYGLYHGAVGFAALPASFLFGVFWMRLGPVTAFHIGALLAAASIVLLFLSGTPDKKPELRHFKSL